MKVLTTPRQLLAAIVMAALMSGLVVVAQPTPEAAVAAACPTPGCGGKLNNQVTRDIFVTNCWHDLSDSWAGATPPCVQIYSQNRYNAAWYVSPRGLSTNLGLYYYDVDAFQAPAGCVTVGYFSGPSQFTIDRRGRSALWKRVYGTSTAFITGIQC